MPFQLRRPETVTIPLSPEHWILVKKRLNAGERRDVYTRIYRAAAGQYDPHLAGRSLVVGYLLDWSIQDADGQVIGLRDLDEEAKGRILDALDMPDFLAIREAVEAHEATQEAARAAEKAADPPGAIASSVT